MQDTACSRSQFMNHDVMRKSCTFQCGPHALEHHENPSFSQHRFLPVLPSKLWPRQVQRFKWDHQSQKQKDHNMAQNLGARTNAHDSHIRNCAKLLIIKLVAANIYSLTLVFPVHVDVLPLEDALHLNQHQ